MKPSSDVLSALNDTYSAESTASERFHKQEHAFEEGKRRIKGLSKWFDKIHHKSERRRHDLRNTILMYEGVVTTELGDTSYSDEPGEALKIACDTLDALAESYQDLYNVIHKAFLAAKGENATYLRALKERHFGTAEQIYKHYRHGQGLQQQLKDLGLPLFIHEHS